MPVRHARSETRGRPPFGRRGEVGKNGSTRSHNGSGSSAAAIPRSRYFAGKDQVSEVLLRALSVQSRFRYICVRSVRERVHSSRKRVRSPACRLDFALSKTFTFNTTKFTPKLDLFNALNADDYSAVANTQYGALTYMQPSVVLQGRIIRAGIEVRW